MKAKHLLSAVLLAIALTAMFIPMVSFADPIEGGITIETNVQSIELVPVQDYELIENYRGIEEEYKKQDEETGEYETIPYFYYFPPLFHAGDQLIVTYKDNPENPVTLTWTPGENEAFVSSDGSIQIGMDGGVYPEIVEWSYFEQGRVLQVGDTYTFQLSYEGVSCDVPVKIVANPMGEVTFKPVEPHVLYEGVNSITEYETIWDEETQSSEECPYTKYMAPSFKEGDKLEITESGETKTYIYATWSGSFINSEDSSDHITIFSEDMCSDQSYDNQWGVGGEGYFFTGSYQGIDFQVPVTIAENPVTKIAYKTKASSPYELIEGIDGYQEEGWEWVDGEDDPIVHKYFYYDCPISFPAAGDQLVVYEGDKQTTYTYNENKLAFVNGTTELGESLWTCSRGDQSWDHPWKGGETHEFTIKYMGRTATVPLKIIKRTSLSGATVTVGNDTYTGSAREPKVTVKVGDKTLTKGTDYKVAYSNNTNAGTASVTVTGLRAYKDSKSETFQIAKANQTVSAKNFTKTYGNAAFSLGATASGKGKLTYTSTNKKVLTVSTTGEATIEGAGTAKVIIKAAATTNYNAASKTITVKVDKAANPLLIKRKKASVRFGSLKSRAKVLRVNSVITFTKKGVGKTTYIKERGTKKIKINKLTGKVTVGKGLGKGTYKVAVNVTAAGNTNYKKVTKPLTLKIIVK